MNQKDALLSQIGSMEGRVITANMARQARGLAGAPDQDPIAASIVPQLCILLLNDLTPKEQTYTIDEIDDVPSHFLMMMSLSDDKKSIRFYLQKK